MKDLTPLPFVTSDSALSQNRGDRVSVTSHNNPVETTRMKKFFRQLTSLEEFLQLPLWAKLLIIIFFSGITILLFAVFLGSVRYSYMAFVDPQAVVDAQSSVIVIVAVVELIIGLAATAFMISVITTSLEETLSNLHYGSLPFRKKEHILIVNTNNKLQFLVDEINYYCRDENLNLDVVIVTNCRNDVDVLRSNFLKKQFSNVTIYIKYRQPLTIDNLSDLSIHRAKALIILSDFKIEHEYERDNANLEIMLNLMTYPPMLDDIRERRAQKQPKKCSIELSGSVAVYPIARTVSCIDNTPSFVTIDAKSIITRVLGRTLVDIAYYKIYSNILSFRGQEIYFLPPGDLLGSTFGAAYMRITKGILIGISRFRDGNFEIQLNPDRSIVFDNSVWMIAILETRNSIRIEKHLSVPESINSALIIDTPSEIVDKHICIIGNHRDFSKVGDFLTESSKQRMKSIVYDDLERYFSDSLVDELISEPYDAILLNLPDHYAFRLSIYLKSHAQSANFAKQLNTVVELPRQAELLSKYFQDLNIVISEMVVAEYIAQVTFQRSIADVYEELFVSHGSEFNILYPGKHIDLNAITDKQTLKHNLSLLGMLYVGILDKDGEVVIDAENIHDASAVYVISDGDQ